MKYLLVVAHPDDETLGCGGSVYKWTKDGNEVDVVIMSSNVQVRSFRPKDEELGSDLKNAVNTLGVKKIYEGDFPNIQMNVVPHLSLVQFIEKVIVESKPDVVITHHPSDVNDDHVQTATACQAAIRLFQRRADVKPLKEFWFMEVLSSTEWAVSSATNKFNPNTFVEIGLDGLEKKLVALNSYRGVMRPYPHPRSEEAVKGLAAYRGAQAGCNYAESFECVFRRMV